MNARLLAASGNKREEENKRHKKKPWNVRRLWRTNRKYWKWRGGGDAEAVDTKEWKEEEVS